jgi:hypothetical protein
MSIQTTCPNCEKKLKVADSLLGKKIKCPGCATIFAVEDSAAGDSDSPAPTAKTARTAPKKQQRPRDDEEDEAPRRPAKTAPKTDDEDDERPKKSSAKKSRRDDEDDQDDEDRPARKGKKKKSSTSMVLLILGGVGLFVCAGGCGLGYYAYSRATKAVGGAMTDAFANLPTAPGPGGPGRNPGGETSAGAKPDASVREWKEFKDDKYGFSVMMPGTPSTGLMGVGINTTKDAHFVLNVPAGQPIGPTTSGYRITFTKLARPENPKTAALDLGMMGFTSSLEVEGNKPVNEKEITFAGQPGRSWDVAPKKGDGVWHFRACIDSANGNAYWLGVGPDSKIPASDAEKFFASFKLLSN